MTEQQQDDVARLSLVELLGRLRPSQLWAVALAGVALLSASFFVGRASAAIIMEAANNELKGKIIQLNIELAKAEFRNTQLLGTTAWEPSGSALGHSLSEGLLPGYAVDDVRRVLLEFRDEGNALLVGQPNDAEFERWRNRVEYYLQLVFAKKDGTVNPHEAFEFSNATYRGPGETRGELEEHLGAGLGVLEAIVAGLVPPKPPPDDD